MCVCVSVCVSFFLGKKNPNGCDKFYIFYDYFNFLINAFVYGVCVCHGAHVNVRGTGWSQLSPSTGDSQGQSQVIRHASLAFLLSETFCWPHSMVLTLLSLAIYIHVTQSRVCEFGSIFINSYYGKFTHDEAAEVGKQRLPQVVVEMDQRQLWNVFVLRQAVLKITM